MMGLRADVEFIAVSANTEKKSIVPDVSKLKERCFGVNANCLNAVQIKICNIADNAKAVLAIICKSSLTIKIRVIMGKEL